MLVFPLALSWKCFHFSHFSSEGRNQAEWPADMHGGCRRKREGRQPPSPLAQMMSVQGVQHQLPFQNKVSGLKPLLPHSQHPRGAGGGCGTSPGCDAVFPASMATCRWALRMQMMSQAQLLPCPPWGFPHSLPYAWYCSWPGLSTFCASWSSPGHALFLPPSYSQGGRLQLPLLTACFHGLFPGQCQERECGLTADTGWLFVFL